MKRRKERISKIVQGRSRVMDVGELEKRVMAIAILEKEP